jgi:Fe-Mn family superoxide dismutase
MSVEQTRPTKGYVPPGGHKLPPLPYPYNALEPVISKRTLRIHHDRHHLAFHGSGHILHSIYWTVMAPGGLREPGYYTCLEIEKYFGGFAPFKEQFTEASIQVEASGWGVLCWVPSWMRLEILTAEKHQNLTQWGAIPLLVVDAWEHAYYLDYQNRRADYVRAWWSLVNWNEVERRLRLAMRTRVPLETSFGM